jgi:formamidopyrimidine-DNA glycosylase
VHDRLVLHLADGMRLAFNDARKFGRVWLVGDPQNILSGLGPEPFDPALDAGIFNRMLQGQHRQIKPLLLDQSFIAGIGNIYAGEALHTAGINPLTPSNQIEAIKGALLLDAIREVLQTGIERNGASFDWVYRGGEYQNQFRVYQRTGEPCPICGSAIERRVIGQRSAHFCPVCQHL